MSTRYGHRRTGKHQIVSYSLDPVIIGLVERHATAQEKNRSEVVEEILRAALVATSVVQ